MTCPTCNDSEKIRVPVWVDGLADFSTQTCPTCRRAGPGFWSKGHVLRAAHQPMIMWDGDMHAAPMPIPYFPDQKWWSNRAAELAAIVGDLETITDKEACRYDLRRFMVHYFPTMFSPLTAAHEQAIEGMQAAILEGGRHDQTMRRGTGATTLMTVAASWALAYGHRRSVMVVSSCEHSAQQVAGVIRDGHRYCEGLARDFPDLKGAIVRAAGITGSFKGMHANGIRPDMAIIDAPHTDLSSKSPSQVRRRIDVISQTIPGLSGPSQRMATVFLDSVET